MRRIAFLFATVGLLLAATEVRAQSVSDSDFLTIEPATTSIPDNSIDTNFNVAILLDNASTLGAIAIPLVFPGHPELRIDTSVVTGGNAGVSYGPAGNAWSLKTSLVDNTGQDILLGFITFVVIKLVK